MAKHKTKQDPNPTPAERKLVDALPMEKIIAMADEARVKYGDDLAAYVQIYNDGEYNITVAARPPLREVAISHGCRLQDWQLCPPSPGAPGTFSLWLLVHFPESKKCMTKAWDLVTAPIGAVGSA